MLKKLRFILAFMSLAICLCFMSTTYSRYVASTTSNIDAPFAKWQILVNNNDITNNANSTMTFTPTIEENRNVAPGFVAPSSKGYFDIVIDPSNVDVSFSYAINLGIENQNMPDLKMTGYAIVPNTYIEGDPLDIIALDDNYSITNALIFDSSTPSFQFKSFTIRVYFEWYEGENEMMNDEDDTAIGKEAAIANTTFTMNAAVSFEQIIE